MANDNETVTKLCEDMRRYGNSGYLAGKGIMDYFADRIIAAYKRELEYKACDLLILVRDYEEAVENLKSHLREAIASRCSCEFKCYWYDSRNNKCLRNDPKNPCCVWPSRVALGEGVGNGK